MSRGESKIYKNLRQLVAEANNKELLNCLISLKEWQMSVDGFDFGDDKRTVPTPMRLVCELYKTKEDAKDKAPHLQTILLLYDFGADINFTANHFETLTQVAASNPEIAKIFSKPRTMVTDASAAPKAEKGCVIS